MRFPFTSAARSASIVRGLIRDASRLGVVSVAACALTLASDASSGTGVIRGRVVDGRGAPVGRATVSAFAIPSPPSSPAGRPSVTPYGPTGRPEQPAAARANPTFEVITDADGSFVITGLPPSSVSLTAHREGFFPASARAAARGALTRQTVVTVSDGAVVTAPDLLLVRGGAITGRVVDAHGDPIVHAHVVPLGYGGDPAQPARMAGSADVTDDRGHYRVYGLRAGRYTVHVTPAGLRGPPPGVIQGDQTEAVRAYAPGTTDIGAAEFVEVAYGADAALDVRLPQGRLATIEGQVSGEGGEPLADVAVSLRPLDARVDLTFGTARTTGSGQFAIGSVPPGRYQVVAEEFQRPRAPAEPMRHRRSGRTSIAVEGAHLTGVVVPIGPGTTLRGRIEIEGGHTEALEGRRLIVQSRRHPSEVLGHAVGVDTTPDVTFVLTGLHGRQLLHVARLPADWWVKSMTIGGADISEGYDFPRGGTIADCVIVVSARPTGITGRVETAGLSPGAAVVVAVPEDGVRLPEFGGWAAAMQAIDADGRYVLRGLRPGRYLVVALTQDVLGDVTGVGPPALLDVLRSAGLGVSVDVREGRFETTPLRLVDALPR